MTSGMSCPFCELPAQRIQHTCEVGVAIRDAYPVSPGHTLIIPLRHVGSFFELSGDERLALLALLDKAKAELDTRLKPTAYNIGINDGAAAGQTISHLHIHLLIFP